MFNFTYDSGDFRNELTVEEVGLSHMEVVEWFEQFLKGCGYSFDGHYQLEKPNYFGDVANEDGRSTFPVI